MLGDAVSLLVQVGRLLCFSISILLLFVCLFVSGFLLTLDLMHFQREAAFLTPDVKSSGHCSMATWEGLVV